MVDCMAMPRPPAALDEVWRRYFFAAWPQAYAHPSWMDALEAATGLRLPRGPAGAAAGLAEQALAHALLGEVGACLSDPVPVDRVPAWAMQGHGPMRRHLSAVAALGILPALTLTVKGGEVRQWDAVLGAGVRQAALCAWRALPETIAPPPRARGLLRAASAAAGSPAEWERFSLGLGLAAVAECGEPVRSRIRLAWPRDLRDVAPFAVEATVQRWLARACLEVAHWLRAGPPPTELAA